MISSNLITSIIKDTTSVKQVNTTMTVLYVVIRITSVFQRKIDKNAFIPFYQYFANNFFHFQFFAEVDTIVELKRTIYNDSSTLFLIRNKDNLL